MLRLEGSIIEVRPGPSMGSMFGVCVELEDDSTMLKGEFDVDELVTDGVTDDDCGAACLRLTASL